MAQRLQELGGGSEVIAKVSGSGHSFPQREKDSGGRDERDHHAERPGSGLPL
jgi:hypothetical protein